MGCRGIEGCRGFVEEQDFRGGPDAVLAVVNAASVERSLYIVSELVALGLPVVVALNMTDVAEQEGRAVDAAVLSSALGLPVIPLVGTSADGTAVDALLRGFFREGVNTASFFRCMKKRMQFFFEQYKNAAHTRHTFPLTSGIL